VLLTRSCRWRPAAFASLMAMPVASRDYPDITTIRGV
jgi:hypothetical protein